MQLANKRCLIVGGTSGIGLAAARRFNLEGARVVVAGLPEHPLADESIITHACDVRRPDDVRALFERSIEAMNGLDVVYHVAGGSGRRFGDGALHECSDAGWRSTIEWNLDSVYHTNQWAIRHFLNSKQPGVILNMASVLACSPSPRYFDTAAYTAAKGAVIALSRYAAARYARDNIRVNVIAPGLIATPMSMRAMSDADTQDFLRAKQPLAGGAGAPEDCVGTAVFLCSDASSLVTGVVVPVDGGWCVCEPD